MDGTGRRVRITPGQRRTLAAALSAFGVGVDIHAGGSDLRFPHHVYHSPIAEAFTRVSPYARAWLYVGVVTIGGIKMAKSVGNLVLVEDLLVRHTAAAIRLMILDRPWSEDWDYSDASLEAAGARLAGTRERLRSLVTGGWDHRPCRER